MGILQHAFNFVMSSWVVHRGILSYDRNEESCVNQKTILKPLVMLSLFLIGCQSHDVVYYRQHPQALFKTLQHCQTKTQPSCQTLKTLAAQFQTLAVELKRDPQTFGQQVLALQTHCASKLQDEACHETLTMMLAIIKWLASPEA